MDNKFTLNAGQIARLRTENIKYMSETFSSRSYSLKSRYAIRKFSLRILYFFSSSTEEFMTNV